MLIYSTIQEFCLLLTNENEVMIDGEYLCLGFLITYKKHKNVNNIYYEGLLHIQTLLTNLKFKELVINSEFV